MNRKLLINKLRLSYFPISTFAFEYIKKESQFKKATSKSNIYFITQQPVLFIFELEDLAHSKNSLIKAKISHTKTSSILELEIDLIKKYNLVENSTYKVELSSFDHLDKSNRQNHYMKVTIDNEFIDYFTPETLLFDSLKKGSKIRIKGNIKEFLTYEVLYVGKAKSVWQRLSGHSTLQKILSTKYSKDLNSMISHEIKLLFFEFEDNMHIDTFDGDFKTEEDQEYFSKALLNDNPLVNRESYYLDAEKAFIKVIKPDFNISRYSNYPKSKDGLFNLNLDTYTYQFIDSIYLIFKNETIKGNPDDSNRDTIIISNNRIIELKKSKL